MKTLISVTSLVLLTIALQTHADSRSEYDLMYDKCVAKIGPINNSVVTICSEAVSEKAKKEIANRYTSIHARIFADSPEDAEKLEHAQKAWIQYRNTYCNLAGTYIGSPMYSFCPMNLNTARALELRELDSR